MRKLRGFTLIELMVAVSVMAILFAIGISFYSNVVQKSARDGKKRADIEAIAKVYETNFPKENKYLAITNDDFTNKVIPTPPEGGSYQCFAGPDTGCKLPLTSEGFKVCATLKDNTLYCRSSTQGSLASRVDLATFFGSPPRWISTSPVASTDTLTVVNPLLINKPADVQQNDLLLAHIAIARRNTDGQLGPNDIGVPNGWTLIQTLDRPYFSLNNFVCSTNIRSAIYWKIAGAVLSDTGPYSWTVPLNNYISGAVVAYRGASTNPIHIAAGMPTPDNVLSTSYTTPQVQTTRSNTMIVTFFTSCGSLSWTPPGGMMNERYDSAHPLFALTISGDDVIQDTVATVLPKTATTTPAAYGTAQIVVLQP